MRRKANLVATGVHVPRQQVHVALVARRELHDGRDLLQGTIRIMW
jgi:hypothetical protein